MLGALGALALRRDDLDEAERRFRAALELAPSYVEAMSNLGGVAAVRGDAAGAEAWYERAIAVDPSYPHEVLVQAGNAARFLGDDAAARDYYAAAGRVRADSWIPPYNLACLAALAGDAGGALALLGEAADRGLAAPPLLDDNDDFASLRATPEWTQLAARVQTAAIVRPRRS